MTIGNRIKILRSELNMTMEKFGERIGLKKSAISLIESGKNSLTDSNIKLICNEYRVNYFWLTEGTGEMFTDFPETIIDELMEEYNLDEDDRCIIENYLKLNKQNRKIFKDYLRSLIDSTDKEEQKKDPD